MSNTSLPTPAPTVVPWANTSAPTTPAPTWSTAPTDAPWPAPTAAPGYVCARSDADTYGALVLLALAPTLLVLLWRTYRRTKRKGASVVVQLLCDRPRLVLVTVYAVTIILGASAAVDACGGVRDLTVDADLQAYIRCDHPASKSYDALGLARAESAQSTCGVGRRRRLAHVSLPSAWVLNEVYVMYALEARPGNVFAPDALEEVRRVEQFLASTPGFDEHCLARHDDYESYYLPARACAPPLGAPGFFFDASSGALAPNVTARAAALAASAVAPNLADRWFGEGGRLGSNVTASHFFFLFGRG